MFQLKEQEKILEIELNEMEANNLQDRYFETLLINILKGISENFKKEIVSIKKREREIVKQNQP